MKQIIDHARRTAESGISALITGPTGTGKEVLARYIYKSVFVRQSLCGYQLPGYPQHNV
jgi:DNA-binding NtrC family response regulator